MKLYLLAHNEENLVKEGDKVKRYETAVATIGTANGQYFAHCHFSISVGLSEAELKKYVNGWGKDDVKRHFPDPVAEVNLNMMFDYQMDFGGLGYDYLQPYVNSEGEVVGYHPGIDCNGIKGGNTDLGYRIKSPVDGEVVRVTDWGTGWGKIVLIKEDEDTMSPENQAFYNNKLANHGWETLEDWVEGARDYKEERDEVREKKDECEKDLDKIEEKTKKEMRLECGKKIELLTGAWEKRMKIESTALKEKHKKEINKLKDDHQVEIDKLVEKHNKYVESCKPMKPIPLTWGEIFGAIYNKIRYY